jgi:hypothetical protein
MNQRFLIIIALLNGIQAFSYDKLMFQNLHSRHMRNFSKKNNQSSEDKALKALIKISQISSCVTFESVLNSSAIKDLFLPNVQNNLELKIQLDSQDSLTVDLLDDETYESLLGVRYLILLYLYDQMFQRYIASTETFLNNLLNSEKYWKYEDFYMKQSWMNKNIAYNFYSSQYHASIQKKIIFLKEMEHQVAYMLGICLYGIAQIEKVSMEDQIGNHIAQFVQLFYQAYNAPTFDKENQKNPIRLYQDLVWINDHLQQHLQDAQHLLDENSKPSFFVDHAVTVSCVAATLVIAAIVYKKYEQDLPSLYNRTKSAGLNFYQEYLINPVCRIKEIVWDRKPKRIAKASFEPERFKIPPIFTDTKLDMKETTDALLSIKIPKREHQPYKKVGVEGDVLGFPLVGVTANSEAHKLLNDKDKLVIDGINSFNSLIDFLLAKVQAFEALIAQGGVGIEKIRDQYNVEMEIAVKSFEEFYNKKIGEELLNPVIECIELNVYLLMVATVLGGSYIVGSGIKKGYNHYIKHENWYVPMRYIIRSIDKLLNKITRADDKPDFAQEGKLYMLIQHLNEYTICLKGEELFLMNNDIEELLSFDLNYYQKRGIVQRMYKTYEFLK